MQTKVESSFFVTYFTCFICLFVVNSSSPMNLDILFCSSHSSLQRCFATPRKKVFSTDSIYTFDIHAWLSYAFYTYSYTHYVLSFLHQNLLPGHWFYLSSYTVTLDVSFSSSSCNVQGVFGIFFYFFTSLKIITEFC